MNKTIYLFFAVIALIVLSVGMLFYNLDPVIVNHTGNITFKDTKIQEPLKNRNWDEQMVAMLEKSSHRNLNVKKYQGKKGLKKDGKVGIDTCSELNVDYAANNDYIITNNLENQFDAYSVIVIEKVESEFDLQIYDLNFYGANIHIKIYNKCYHPGHHLVHRLDAMTEGDPPLLVFVNAQA